MSGAVLIAATAGSHASPQGLYSMATNEEHTGTAANRALASSDAMPTTPRLERCPSVTASAARRPALDHPSHVSRSLIAAASALLHHSIAAVDGADAANLQRSLVLLEAVCASIESLSGEAIEYFGSVPDLKPETSASEPAVVSKQMRGSLGLSAQTRASFERAFGVSPEDWFASVPEPELSSSELAVLSEQKEAIAESVRAHDSQMAAPISASNAALHRSMKARRALIRARKSLDLRVLRESLALLPELEQHCDRISREDCAAYFRSVQAPELPPQPATIPVGKAFMVLRESLALSSAFQQPCERVSMEDCATFFREYGTDATLSSSSSVSSCGSGSSSPHLGSSADLSAYASSISSSPSPCVHACSGVCPLAGNTSCCATSSVTSAMSCCPALAHETAAEETAAAGPAAATAKGGRSGGLKRKLHKLLRGVFGSCVGHSVDAL